MKSALLLVGMFAATFVTAAKAQTVFVLKPENPPAVGGETRCPPLFVLRNYGILFKYQDASGKLVIDSIPPGRATTKLPTDQKESTVEMKKDDDGQIFATFRLSAADYPKAPKCVPPPEP